MGTRVTITYGEGFSLENECFDEPVVYLELSDKLADFVATPGSVEISIPLAVWEHIRKFTHTNMNSIYANKTDQAIEEMAEDQCKNVEYANYMFSILANSSIENLKAELIERGKSDRDWIDKVYADAKSIADQIVEKEIQRREMNEKCLQARKEQDAGQKEST